MFCLRLTVALLALTSFTCGAPAVGFPVDALDFAEVRSGGGWRLRIHGDGSASLRHNSLPAYFLHYPVGTFDVRPARRISRRCHEIDSPADCVTLRYYTAFTDEEKHCPCAPGSWPTEIIATALGRMDEAVEGEGSRVSRRMLARLRTAN